MSVKIDDRTPLVLSNMDRVKNLAVRFAADDVVRVSRKITPYSGAIKSQGGKSLTGGGHLRNDIVIKVNGGKARIKWGKNYAAIQEEGVTWGKKIKNYTTPGTGPHFAEKSIKKIDKDRNDYLKRAAAIL